MHTEQLYDIFLLGVATHLNSRFKYKNLDADSVQYFAQRSSLLGRAAVVPRQLGHASWVRMPPLRFTHPQSRSNTPQPVCNETSPLHYKECACSLKLFAHQQQSYAWHTSWKSTHAASSAPLLQHGRLSLVSRCLPPSLPEQPHVSFRIHFSLPFFTCFQISSPHNVFCVSALAAAMGSVKEKGGKSQVRSVMRLLLLCQ